MCKAAGAGPASEHAPSGRGHILTPQRSDLILVQDVLSNGPGALSSWYIYL